MTYQLIAINVENRNSSATEVQKALTDFGCFIKVRLGLHDVPTDACSPNGLIVLEVVAQKEEIKGFVKKLNSLDGVHAKDLTV